MPKPKYFNTDKFVQEILDTMYLAKVDEYTVARIRSRILARLNERIMAIIMRNFGKKEVDLFHKVKADHPEIDELDTIMIMLPSIHGLKEKIMDGVNDLYSELTFYAERLQKEKQYLLSRKQA